MKPLIVQKYGGSSLARPDQILQVAKRVSELYHRGHRLLIVVSAMGKTTDDLVKLAYQVSPTPNRRELDMLLTTGERVSMSLMSMALHDLGCPAISFTGSQAGVFTDSAHSNARIADIKPVRVGQALDAGQIVVLAGFQGVDPISKEITTLGRGGSDTTAVAMATYFQAQECQILKDVDGVHTADPRVVPEARSLKTVSYDSLSEMCFWGAKVLHFRSVVLARKLKLPLFVGSTENPERGTKVNAEVSMYEKEEVLSVNSHEEVLHFRVRGESADRAMKLFDEYLQQLRLPWPQILACAYEDGYLRIMLTGTQETLKAMSNGTKQFVGVESMNKTLSSVTATCHGSAGSSLASDIMKLLGERGVTIEKMLVSPLSVSAFVHQDHRERAVKALHEMVVKTEH